MGKDEKAGQPPAQKPARRKPGKHRAPSAITVEQKAVRHARILSLLAQYVRPTDMFRIVAEEFKVDERTVRTWAAEVNETLDKSPGAKLAVEEVRRQQALLIEGIRDTIMEARAGGRFGDALRGYDKLAKIFGIADRLEISGPSGGAIVMDLASHLDVTKLSEEDLDDLDRITARQLEATGGGPPGPGAGGEGPEER